MKPVQPTRAERRHRYRPALSTLINAHVRRTLAHRYGYQLPDDDAGREDLFIALQALAATGTGEPNVRQHMAAIAPWMRGEAAAHLLDRVYDKPLRFRADTMARALGVDDATRTLLKVWTIGATDVTKAERLARRKAKKIARRRAKRRSAGVKTRATYEAESASRNQPWRAFGWSRAKWYRQGRPDPETSLTPSILTLEGVGVTPVSPALATASASLRLG